jgi:activator of HSP90 ATPase
METISNTSYHSETVFSTESEKIFELLTNGAKFGDVTGMSGKGGGTQGAFFSLFGDFVTGRQIELIPNERIVQAWRMMDWEPGVYSLVQFSFIPEGDNTKLVIDHYGYPERHADHIATNWEPFYLTPFAKHFERNLV